MSEEKTDRERFGEYVQASAIQVGLDLTRLLNRCAQTMIVVNNESDEDGTTHTVEWAFSGERYSINIDWDTGEQRWIPGEVQRW